MLRRAALLACLAAPHVVAAQPGPPSPSPSPSDDSTDPFGRAKKAKTPVSSSDRDDLFGLRRKKPEPPPSCADGKTLGCASAGDPFDEVTPFALRTWLAGQYLQTLPIGDARHDQVADFAIGASSDRAGVAFGGATGLENRWTIEGAPVENPRTGGLDIRVPVTFIDQLLVINGGTSARDRVGTGGMIDVQLLRGGDTHVAEARAWIGLTAPPKQRPIIPGTYQVRRLEAAVGPELDASLVASGPLPKLAGGVAWYAAGVAPTLQLSDFEWRASRLVDSDNNGAPDGLPGIVILDPIATTREKPLGYLIPAMARLGWERGPHQVELTLLGNFAHSTAYFANATIQAAGIDRAQRSVVGIASWRGTWKDVRARVNLAWHHGELLEDAHDPAAAKLPKLQSAYIPEQLAEDPLLAEQCRNGAGDPTPMVDNCPVPFGFFGSGGAGRLADNVSDHPTVTADVARRWGNHLVRAGGTLEDTRLIVTSRFTGGHEVRSLFPGHTDTRQFYTTCDPDPLGPCDYAPRSRLSYRTRYTAAYVEDTFEPVPGLRVDGGLRWELMWVGPRLHLSKQWAPRVGLSWDFLGKDCARMFAGHSNCSRLFASLGRSFVVLPAGMGPSVIARDRIVADVDAGALGQSRNFDVGAVFSVADDIQPAAQDEATFGIELGLARLIRATAWVQGRTLRRGYETILVDETTGQVTLDNPGRTDGRPPASRDAVTAAFELAVTASKRMTFRGGLSWNRTVGTWPGPFDPRQGAALYAGTDYDLDASNLFGRLPSDSGARGYVEIVRRGKLGGIPVGASGRLTVASGLPRDVLADSDLGIIQLLPRGAAGRELLRSEANIRLSARLGGFDVTLDVFDVFDQRVATDTNRIYAGESVLPIHGGELADLVFLKNDGGSIPDRRPAFGTPTAFAAPLSILLGARRAF